MTASQQQQRAEAVYQLAPFCGFPRTLNAVGLNAIRALMSQLDDEGRLILEI